MKYKFICILASLLFLSASAYAASSTVYVVDVDRIFSASKAAQAGQAHVKEARTALEQGFDQLRQTYDKQPEDIRQRVLNEGASTLSRQLSLEQQAVNLVISNMMLNEIRNWRKANNANIVIAKQNLLDAADSVDITAAILQAMDAQTPKFADLPVVSITPPQAPAPSPAPKSKNRR